MSKILSLVLTGCLLAFPLATYAADYGSQPTPQTQQSLPVAQPLVREGDFAIKLAAELGLGSPSDEAAAEEMLVKTGVSPANGWISDYPVTPEIIGQLDESLSAQRRQVHCPCRTKRQSSILWIPRRSLLCPFLRKADRRQLLRRLQRVK